MQIVTRRISTVIYRKNVSPCGMLGRAPRSYLALAGRRNPYDALPTPLGLRDLAGSRQDLLGSVPSVRTLAGYIHISHLTA